MSALASREELQSRKTKLADSYRALSNDLNSVDLRSVGNYTIGQLIGKGSFGKVYLATHNLTTGCKVVLKSANKNDSNLAREIHHHRQFLHPHIARLYEVIVTEQLVWLVLEYCPGDELLTHLSQQGPLPFNKVAKIFTQLVGAVAYIHGMFCVHRDLKLENILLDKNGNVKLCDFGFTREYEANLSHLQTFCGTVCYSAPEMLKGEKYAGEKVDVWSLGVILYALLTGELPFEEDDDISTKHKILSSEPKYPDTMTYEIRQLLSRMLSKRPILRPSISDILGSSPFAEHASHQQAILKVTRPLPFTTELEKSTLGRLRSAGVDTNRVMENVIAQRCDPLAGWWALMLEKEDRKQKRSEQRRRDKEANFRNKRRLSSASVRQDRLTLSLKEVDELEAYNASLPNSTVQERRNTFDSPSMSPGTSEALGTSEIVDSQYLMKPLPIEKGHGSLLSAGSTRQTDISGAREGTGQLVPESRTGPYQVSTTHAERASRPQNHSPGLKYSRKNQHRLLNQWINIKHWIRDSTKLSRASDADIITHGSSSRRKRENNPDGRKDTALMIDSHSSNDADFLGPVRLLPTRLPPNRQTAPLNDRVACHSPNQLTPRSSYRHSSSMSGLRKRKSTSSSISSIRSVHHLPSHSKASSTSSTANSTKSTLIFSKHVRSPHNSVKVLPSTPTVASFPSNIRIIRSPVQLSENADLASRDIPDRAKRRGSPYRGLPPLLIASRQHGSKHQPWPSDFDPKSPVDNATRKGNAMIKEENEDDIEEVDCFSPLQAETEVAFWEASQDDKISS